MYTLFQNSHLFALHLLTNKSKLIAKFKYKKENNSMIIS